MWPKNIDFSNPFTLTLGSTLTYRSGQLYFPIERCGFFHRARCVISTWSITSERLFIKNFISQNHIRVSLEKASTKFWVKVGTWKSLQPKNISKSIFDSFLHKVAPLIIKFHWRSKFLCLSKILVVRIGRLIS